MAQSVARSPQNPAASFELLGDDALVTLALEDDDAFAQLYIRHRPAVLRYLMTYAASIDDASDLTQQVFIKALERLPEYERRGLPFAASLIRIARNAAVDLYRKQRRLLPWDHLQERVDMSTTYDPETYALRMESLNQLRLLIGRLPASKQECLALRFAAGLTSREIAAVTDRSEGAVQKELARTLQCLKERYHVRHH